MAKFERIITREEFEDFPRWRKGYKFESTDYNRDVVVEKITGLVHSADSVRLVEETKS